MRETLSQSRFQKIFWRIYRDLKFSDIDIGIFLSVFFLSMLHSHGCICNYSSDRWIFINDFNHILKLVIAVVVGLYVFSSPLKYGNL